MSKKQLLEKKLIEGLTYHTAHADELAAVSLEDLGLELSESSYQAAMKRIESLFDAAEPGTSEGDELEKLAVLVEEYEAKHFPF